MTKTAAKDFQAPIKKKARVATTSGSQPPSSKRTKLKIVYSQTHP